MTVSQMAASVAWGTMAKVLQLLATLVTLAVIGHYVGPEAFGIFSLLWVVVGLVEQTLHSAAVDSLVAQREPSERQYSSMFWSCFAVAALAAASVAVFNTPIAHWLGGDALLAALLFYRALFIPLTPLLSVTQTVLMKQGKFKSFAQAEMAASLAAAAIAIGLALAGYGVWSLLISELVRIGLQALMQVWVSRWWPRLSWSLTAMTEMAALGTQSVGSSFLGFAIRATPRLVIGQTLGAQALGYFAMAERLCDQIVRILVLPRFDPIKIAASRSRDDLASLRQLLLTATSSSSLLAYPVLLGGAALAPVLVPAVLGAQWLPAVVVVQLMLIASLRSPLSAFFAAIFIGIGKPGKHTVLQVTQLSLTVLCCVLAAPFGLTAVCFALIVRNAVSWVIGTWVMKRAIGIPVASQAGAGFDHLAASALMAGAVIVWVQTSGHWLPSNAVLLGALLFGPPIYGAALARLAPNSWLCVCALARRLTHAERFAIKPSVAATDTIGQGYLRKQAR